MEIVQSFELPFTADAVWQCFHDTAGIVDCLPGASLSAAPEGGRLPLAMTVKLGPIVASFAGEAQMVLDGIRRSGSVTGSGSDRKSGSRVKGTAHFAVFAAESPAGAARVEVRVDYSIAGSLAQFSRGGIVQELAERLTAAFRDNLKVKLEADQSAQEPSMAQAPAMAPVNGAAVGPTMDLSPTGHGAASVAAGTAALAVRQTAPKTSPQSAPLDLGGLFWSLLLRRLRRFFGLAARP